LIIHTTADFESHLNNLSWYISSFWDSITIIMIRDDIDVLYYCLTFRNENFVRYFGMKTRNDLGESKLQYMYKWIHISYVHHFHFHFRSRFIKIVATYYLLTYYIWTMWFYKNSPIEEVKMMHDSRKVRKKVWTRHIHCKTYIWANVWSIQFYNIINLKYIKIKLKREFIK